MGPTQGSKDHKLVKVCLKLQEGHS